MLLNYLYLLRQNPLESSVIVIIYHRPRIIVHRHSSSNRLSSSLFLYQGRKLEILLIVKGRL